MKDRSRQKLAMHYDLTDLKVFIAVVEERNLSRGAERCHLAPSSVSLRLKGLEEVLGVQLLLRQARGVRPTQAGLVMLEHARRCVAQLEQMHADLEPYARGITGHVTLFANNNVINSQLPEDLSRFFADNPSIRVTLEERLGSDIVPAVAAGRADLGIAVVGDPHPELLYLPYCEDEFVVIAPLGSPLAQRATTRFIDCLKEPFISLQNGMALHIYQTQQAHALGGRLDIRVQVSSHRSVVRLVSAGAGVAVLPRSVLNEEGLARVAVLRLAESWALRLHRICVKPAVMADNPMVRKLIEVLRQRAG